MACIDIDKEYGLMGMFDNLDLHELLREQVERHLAWGLEGLPGLLESISEFYRLSDADRLSLRRELAERQRAEGQLEGLLSLLGATLETTADSILALDAEGRIIRFNQRLVDMWGVPDELLAFWAHDSLFQHMLAQLGEPEDFRQRFEFLSLHPEEGINDTLRFLDGRIIECWSVPGPAGMADIGRVYSFRDITARVQAEEAQRHLIRKLEQARRQLVQAEKMASIGQLAAGVAHEINNPIGFVHSNLGTLGYYLEHLLGLLDAYESGALAQQARPEGEAVRKPRETEDLAFIRRDARDLLRESLEGTARVKRIVQDLRDFSQAETAQWQVVDLHQGLDSALNILGGQLRARAEVLCEYGDLPAVDCLASQLNQVFMNILVNAAEAIPAGARGRITVRTGSAEAMVWAEFSDDGAGIAPEILSRIFDPFFTTKPVGEGRGLGLSLAYGIVEQHGGRIEVDSTPGRGSTFRVWLPVRPAH